MRLPLVLGSLVLLPLGAVFATVTFSQQEEPGQDRAEAMKKWAAFGTPGPEHKFLEAFVGTWKVDTRFWEQGPASEPVTSTGTSTVKWILGGRYLSEDYRSTFMDQPFRGQGITGFDRFRKRYMSFWIDNLGTSMSISAGTLESGGKVLNLYGTMDDPVHGGIGKMYRTKITLVGKDEHRMEMFDLAAGPDVKIFELVYTRARS